MVECMRNAACEPFCFPMPLTEEYVKTCEMKVVDNPELLEVQP